MKVLGIIAEYNPFHNGHEYQIRTARRLTGADFVVAVMSGDFVQRGEPAVYDKYTRTRMALSCGADLVLELPAMWACASAEDFAAGAVALLSACGVADILCFGTESGKITDFMAMAGILAAEPDEYRLRLKEELRLGRTFPQARQAALSAVCPENATPQTPNDILGLEYCKAIIRQQSCLKPVAIPRIGNAYHDTGINGCFSSATALRHALSENRPADVKSSVPDAVWELMQHASPIFPDSLSLPLNCRLLQLARDGIALTDFCDLSEELAARMKRQLYGFSAFSKRIDALKTKQYTYTRISRALLHILLDLKTTEAASFRQSGYIRYIRILGFRRESGDLLKKLKDSSRVPLITKTADAPKLLPEDALTMFQQDINCSHIYQALRCEAADVCPRTEYQSSPVIL